MTVVSGGSCHEGNNMEATLNGTAAGSTNASAQVIAPRKRAKTPSTPRSEIPKNAHAARSNGAPSQGQSAPQVDYGAIVAECAGRKSAIGQTFVGKQGKQHLFASACAAVKSMLGIAKFMDDGKTPTRLDQVHVDGILDAMKDFWNSKIDLVKAYGEIRSVTFDKPSAEFTKVLDNAGNVIGTKATPKLNARAHVQKACRDDKESALMLSFLVAQAKKRVDFMKGIVTPGGNASTAGAGKYTREEIAKAEERVAILEASQREYAAKVPAAPAAAQ
jgi:hypothetical protein